MVTCLVPHGQAFCLYWGPEECQRLFLERSKIFCSRWPGLAPKSQRTILRSPTGTCFKFHTDCCRVHCRSRPHLGLATFHTPQDLSQSGIPWCGICAFGTQRGPPDTVFCYRRRGTIQKFVFYSGAHISTCHWLLDFWKLDRIFLQFISHPREAYYLTKASSVQAISCSSYPRVDDPKYIGIIYPCRAL